MNPIRKLINAVKSLTEKKWERTTPAEKHHAKWIGRIATRFRGRKVKNKAAAYRSERKAAIKAEKRMRGRRLTSEEMGDISEILRFSEARLFAGQTRIREV